MPLKAPALRAVYDWTEFYVGGEQHILEEHHACAVDKDFTLTADYQLVVNPAYNADRGPASILSGRLHGEFQTRRL
jgi:Carbohydrate-selective porin, OprB family